MSPKLRPELTELPARMRSLPLDPRGYPIPEFVGTVNGQRDFRFVDQKHWIACVRQRICWVCGDTLGGNLAFLIGPMCAVNRTTSEPPCHRDCAVWSAKNCPFLARPHMVRREDELTEATKNNAGGCPILRNPGVALVWITRSYRVWRDDKDAPLITVGDPIAVEWYSEGRKATRAEVRESIRTGLPILEKIAEREVGGLEELRRRHAEVERLLPAVAG